MKDEMRAFRLTMQEPTETEVLSDVLHALKKHPAVGHVWRVNTGAGRLLHPNGASRFLRFGFVGCPDLHGYLRDGRALYCEVKRPSGKVSIEQQQFIDHAKRQGCVAFVARSVADVFNELGKDTA